MGVPVKRPFSRLFFVIVDQKSRQILRKWFSQMGMVDSHLWKELTQGGCAPMNVITHFPSMSRKCDDIHGPKGLPKGQVNGNLVGTPSFSESDW